MIWSVILFCKKNKGKKESYYMICSLFLFCTNFVNTFVFVVSVNTVWLNLLFLSFLTINILKPVWPTCCVVKDLHCTCTGKVLCLSIRYEVPTCDSLDVAAWGPFSIVCVKRILHFRRTRTLKTSDSHFEFLNCCLSEQPWPWRSFRALVILIYMHSILLLCNIATHSAYWL